MQSRRQRAFLKLAGITFLLSLVTTPSVQAQPPLAIFAGQQLLYQWVLTGQIINLFPGQNLFLEIVLYTTYMVVIVNPDNYTAIVMQHADVSWPPDSTNRTIILTTPDFSGTQVVLDAPLTFAFTYHTTISTNGTVLALSDNNQFFAIFSFPNATRVIGYTFQQDLRTRHTLYFLHEVNTTTGEEVGMWWRWNRTVIRHKQIETAVGVRPAITLRYSAEGRFGSNPPGIYNETGVSTYDLQTGFLLKANLSRHETTPDWESLWRQTCEVIATNMYLPRAEHVIPLAAQWAIVISVFVPIAVLVSLLGPRRKTNKSTEM